MFKVLAAFVESDSYPVTWAFDGKTHDVRYGSSQHQFGNSLSAGREFGECVRHALECAGKFDEEG